MAYLIALAGALFIAGAVMNNECKSNRQHSWCTPERPHASLNHLHNVGRLPPRMGT